MMSFGYLFDDSALFLNHICCLTCATQSDCYLAGCVPYSGLYFLDTVEKKQYGWFWVCPNGSKNCHYRHALPLGYVLKSQMKALLEEESEKITIEEEIENQVKVFFYIELLL